MNYKGHSISEVHSRYLVMKDGEYDYEQIPFLNVEAAMIWIDMPQLAKEVKRLFQQMFAGNMLAVDTLQAVEILLREQDVPDNFFEYFSQKERRDILTAFFNASGVNLVNV